MYTLNLNDEKGPEVDKTDESKPLVFLFGAGNLLPKFEENIQGLEKNDLFSFHLPRHEAYGEINPDAKVDIPKSVFEVDGKLQDDMLVPGKFIPMQNEKGQPLNGKVINVEEEIVKMDFNHPLAGQNLYFKGQILEIRDASEEEITHGHVHGAGGHHH